MASFLINNDFTSISETGGIQRDWLFKVEIIIPDGLPEILKDEKDQLSPLGYIENFLTFKVRSFTLPSIKLATVPIKFLGYTKDIPMDIEQEETVDILFEENESKDIYNLFYNWITTIRKMKKLENKNKKKSPLETMKTKIKIYTLDSTTQFHDTKYVFYNAYPLDIGGAEYNYNGTGSITYNVKFSFGEMEQETNKEENSVVENKRRNAKEKKIEPILKIGKGKK